MKTTMHLHGDKDSNYDIAQGLGLSEAAQDQFKYALYEVEFDVEVDANGEYTILEVRENGQVLRPVNGGLTDGYSKTDNVNPTDGSGSNDLSPSETGEDVPRHSGIALRLHPRNSPVHV